MESVGRFDREAIFEMRSDGLEQTEDRVRILAGLMGCPLLFRTQSGWGRLGVTYTKRN